MAKHVLKNAQVVVNAVDLSDHVRSVTVTTNRPEVDVTAMGAAYQEVVGGIPTASITVEYYNDYAAGEVWITHNALSTTDTPFMVAVRPVATTVGATNPEFQMTALMLGDYTPLSGSVGEANMVSITYTNASQTGLVADVTP